MDNKKIDTTDESIQKPDTEKKTFVKPEVEKKEKLHQVAKFGVSGAPGLQTIGVAS